MNIRPSAIFRQFQAQGVLSAHRGGDLPVGRIAPIEECEPGDLVFVDHAKYLGRVRAQQPSAVVTTEAISQELGEDTGDLALLIAPNVRLAIALLKQAYADRDVRAS